MDDDDDEFEDLDSDEDGSEVSLAHKPFSHSSANTSGTGV